MHWGLTTFERKRIERIALDHPYFDMHAPLLTKKELRTILAQRPRKTGPQVISEVKKELGMEYVPATQKKRTLTEALCDASFVPSFRRTVVLSVFCLLLVLFMTLTVPGKAFAEEIYSLVIDFVDGVFGVSNIAPTTNDFIMDLSSIPDDIDTPEELSKKTGLPVLIADDTLSSFKYSIMEEKVLTIRSRYEASDGRSYSVIQRIGGLDTLWTSRDDVNGIVLTIATDGEFKLFSMTANDGTVVINGYAESFMITITSRTLEESELISSIEKLHYVN